MSLNQRANLDRHVSADTPEECAARMERAARIMQDPLSYWREFGNEPRSLTAGMDLGSFVPRPIRREPAPHR